MPRHLHAIRGCLCTTWESKVLVAENIRPTKPKIGAAWPSVESLLSQDRW